MPTSLDLTAVWAAYHERHDPEARATLIEAYQHLVTAAVRRCGPWNGAGLDREDQVSDGAIGLIQAIDRFDPSRGVPFEGYAGLRIRGAILDGLRRLRAVPTTAARAARQLQDATAALEQQLGRSVSRREAATDAGLSLAEYDSRSHVASDYTQSLDALLDDTEEADPVALACADPAADPQAALDDNAQLMEVERALSLLSERERLVLDLYYRQELMMREISQVLSVSEGRVCQLHARAMARLRAEMTRRGYGAAPVPSRRSVSQRQAPAAHLVAA